MGVDLSCVFGGVVGTGGGDIWKGGGRVGGDFSRCRDVGCAGKLSCPTVSTVTRRISANIQISDILPVHG